MSILPISTNFTGIQKKLVPKCILVDIYDLKMLSPTIFEHQIINIDPNFPQTLCVLAAGSIITKITITSPFTFLQNGEIVMYPYVILFQSGTTFESSLEINPNFGIFGNSNSIFQISSVFERKEVIYEKMGTQLSVNSQIYVIAFVDNQLDILIPHMQCLIEYIAEENIL